MTIGGLTLRTCSFCSGGGVTEPGKIGSVLYNACVGLESVTSNSR
jgi:hypothetical protein